MLRGWLAAVMAFAVMVVVPGATAAEPPKPVFDGAIELSGSHGFHVFGFVLSDGKVGHVLLIAGKRGEAASYEARGEGSANGVDIDLGSLGKIDVEVQPSGKTETIHEGCGGKRKAIRVAGTELVGTIEFHGEEGFTEFETTHTPLLLQPLLGLVCGAAGTGTESGNGVPGVEVTAGTAGGPSLLVEQNRPGAPVFYEANEDEKQGSVRISRSVRGHLGAGALRYDPSLATASFSAASPFTGKATYAERSPPTTFGPGFGTWRGSLKVDFPGDKGARVAGAGFKASIIHARRTESNQ